VLLFKKTSFLLDCHMIVTDFLQLRCLFIFLIYRTVRDRALISVTRIVALHKLTTAAFTVWHANPIRCAAGCVDVAITPPPMPGSAASPPYRRTTPLHHNPRVRWPVVVSLVALVTLGSVPPRGLLVRSVPTSMALLRQCAPVVGFQSY
jgi:hypothetical protein